jgi:hypothetical protein
MPETYVLPKEYVTFIETFLEWEEKDGKQNYWIVKPAAKSRGRGIFVINDVTQITYGEPLVVQKYLKNPLLMNGFKFDLRIYVTVTSYNPLEAFIYKEGFARLSTTPFTLDPESMTNKFIHLTNYSIQKKAINRSDIDNSYGGTKISLTSLKKYYKEKGLDYEDMWEQSKAIWVKSLIACQNEIPYNPWCFELYGYDIMIDDNGRWWLVEINSSPSLAREHLLDDIVKQRLIDDTIDLVDPLDFDRKRLFEVLERRISQDLKQNTSASGTNARKHIMNRDLTYILNGAVPRSFGEDPRLMGNYERIAPTELSDKYVKMLGGQKLYGSLMKVKPEAKSDDKKDETI